MVGFWNPLAPYFLWLRHKTNPENETHRQSDYSASYDFNPDRLPALTSVHCGPVCSPNHNKSPVFVSLKTDLPNISMRLNKTESARRALAYKAEKPGPARGPA